MQQQIMELINSYGYFGIVLLIALENIFPPIPSEIILTFAGFVTLSSNLGIIESVLAATAGAVIGAIALYAFGRILTRERLVRFVESRIGRILRLKISDIDKAEALFSRHGHKTVFFGRCVPVVRSLVSIPAGMTKMPLHSFLLFTTLGTLIWNTVLIILGRLARHAWTQVSSVVDSFSTVITIGIAGGLIVGAFFYYQKRVRSTK